jgi:hypothetical protein
MSDKNTLLPHCRQRRGNCYHTKVVEIGNPWSWLINVIVAHNLADVASSFAPIEMESNLRVLANCFVNPGTTFSVGNIAKNSADGSHTVDLVKPSQLCDLI